MDSKRSGQQKKCYLKHGMIQTGLTKFVLKDRNVNETQHADARYVICSYFEISY